MQGGTFDKLQDGIFCISVYWIGGEMRPMLNEETTAVLRSEAERNAERPCAWREGVVPVRLCRTPVVMEAARRSTRSTVGLKGADVSQLGEMQLSSALSATEHTL